MSRITCFHSPQLGSVHPTKDPLAHGFDPSIPRKIIPNLSFGLSACKVFERFVGAVFCILDRLKMFG